MRIVKCPLCGADRENITYRYGIGNDELEVIECQSCKTKYRIDNVAKTITVQE